jgi:UDP-N-acetylmuramoyl-L-alanyl-D-glutamate--2,6-diaminopimelate ligase
MIEKILNFGRKLIPKKLFKLGQPIYHYLLAVSGNIVYRFPGRKLKVIGVTGTNGKSTTVELVNALLKEAGFKSGMLSTVAFEIAGKRTDNATARTTLGRWQTPKMLRRMVKAGCDYAVLEVASEGIVQFRTWGIPFDVAVFTNLSPEHLNTHKTMVNYRNAKGKLFANLSLSKRKKNVPKINVFNADDKEAGYFGAFPADKYFGYGLKNGDVRADKINLLDGLDFVIKYNGKNYPIKSKLKAQFNVYNLIAAWCVGFSQGIAPAVIKKGLESVALIEGRMQEIPNNRGIKVVVDYAMTPDSYQMLFAELRKITPGKLIAVFGAAGDRDKSKRPKIGEISARDCDLVILTDDEPYSEDPAQIVTEIEAGAKKVKNANYQIIHDRKKALKKAIEVAQKGDTIVVPGMGHEKNRNVGGNKRIPWNEVQIIKELLTK